MQCLRFRPCVRRPGTCASMRRLRKGRCRSSHYISLRFLKPAVLQALEECPLFLHGASSYVQPPQSSLPPSDCRHPCSVRARIRAEEKRLERLRLAYEAGADSLEEYQQRKQEIRKKSLS